MATTALRRRRVSRWGVAVRVLAAIPANYLLTSLATACLARVLAMPPAEASVAATLFSFALFAMLALTAFAMRSIVRLWLWMIGAGIVLGGGLWLSLATGGRL
ncbi:hypothetical protein DFR49_3893 [Hephaestia caeni]|uniref:Iron transporter n=1 Tax=Hephaestia caeni TaxID=645617 RepID=A0A397NGJ4_9SPHN|nr:hypothetical protein [Hephaestia caeni]RIA36610.1 hypothetical protein DFR49_3893 [Hephaestia caeni]